jgi:hypothetical protein
MTTKEYFLHAKIVKGKETSTLELFNILCPDFTLLRGKTPQTQLKSIWDAFDHFIATLRHESWSQAGQIDIVTAAALITNT